MAYTPRPFDPKPYGLGSVVELDGESFSVQSPGRLAASVWAVSLDSGAWALLKRPTPSRGGYAVEKGLGADGHKLATEAAA